MEGAVSVRKDWPISCRDAVGRRRDIVVLADGERVVLVAPPGEMAVLTVSEVNRLRAALLDAIAEVWHE
jgi:hypothetical protein